MIVIGSAEALRDNLGQVLGPSPWLVVSQDDINAFADLTGDHQWIHVDVKRAAREMPGGRTIAHGYLVLSLVNRLFAPLCTIEAKQAINYGIDRLRFLSPVPSGSRLRLSAEISNVEPVGESLRTGMRLTFEAEGQERPALVAEAVFLYTF